MISLTKKRDQQGFTIVELLIVIVVIGILAALVVTTYAGIQSKARDSKRKTDIAAIQTNLEAYYAEKNHYPTLADLNNTGDWRTTNMKSLKEDSLKDPKGSSATLVNTEFTAAPSTWAYSYRPVTEADAACTNAEECVGYTVSAWLEGENAIYSKTESN